MPFPGLKRPDFYSRVVDKGERPHLNPEWPEQVRHLLESCWRTNLDERLSFREVGGILKVKWILLVKKKIDKFWIKDFLLITRNFTLAWCLKEPFNGHSFGWRNTCLWSMSKRQNGYTRSFGGLGQSESEWMNVGGLIANQNEGVRKCGTKSIVYPMLSFSLFCLRLGCSVYRAV